MTTLTAGDRFRHATTFLRWRTDKPAAACRYDQLETVPQFELKQIFGRVGRAEANRAGAAPSPATNT